MSSNKGVMVMVGELLIFGWGRDGDPAESLFSNQDLGPWPDVCGRSGVIGQRDFGAEQGNELVRCSRCTGVREEQDVLVVSGRVPRSVGTGLCAS